MRFDCGRRARPHIAESRCRRGATRRPPIRLDTRYDYEPAPGHVTVEPSLHQITQGATLAPYREQPEEPLQPAKSLHNSWASVVRVTWATTSSTNDDINPTITR
jgi:hypothetical protein